MQFQGADYALCGAAALFVGLGRFRGFSGVFAFLVASVATAFASVRIWPRVEVLTDIVWLRVGLAVFAGVVVFGVVRIIVKKVVNGLLAQPVDAIAGCVVGLVCGAMVVLAASYFPFVRDRSAVAREVAVHVW